MNVVFSFGIILLVGVALVLLLSSQAARNSKRGRRGRGGIGGLNRAQRRQERALSRRKR